MYNQINIKYVIICYYINYLLYLLYLLENYEQIKQFNLMNVITLTFYRIYFRAIHVENNLLLIILKGYCNYILGMSIIVYIETLAHSTDI